jgi:hypothetical protein
MRKFLFPLVMALPALALAAPASAQRSAAPPAVGYHPSSLEMALSARLQSIRSRIELLREEGLMASEEARDLRQQSRTLEQRLIGLTARDAGAVELAISRLQERVRFVTDDSLSGGRAFASDEGLFEDRGSFEGPRPSGFNDLDRHILPPVDRWGDPFDRGDEF